MAVLLIAAQMQMASGMRAQGIVVEGLYFGGTEQQWTATDQPQNPKALQQKVPKEAPFYRTDTL
eukprot:251738-Amphidinium_carterae.1